MDQAVTLLIVLCALGCALNGGVFFAFSSFVMAALARLPPGAGISAMQAINVSAVTPAFMTLLFGTAALSALAILVALLRWEAAGAAAALLGGILYLTGAIAVTMLRNVPLNNALARVAAAAALFLAAL